MPYSASDSPVMISGVAIAFFLPGSIPVYVFSLLIGAGAALGISSLVLHESLERLLPAGFTVLITALAGAKLGYVFFQPGSAQLSSPFSGLSWGGAFAGGSLGAIIAGRAVRLPLRRLADALVPLAAALTVAAWLGCWVDGCAYGQHSEAWFAIMARDEWGNLAARFPLQLMGALLAFITLTIADFIAGRTRRSGFSAAVWILLTGAQFIWLQGLRADSAMSPQNLRPDLWAAWTLFAAGAVFFTLLAANKFQPETQL